MDIQMLMLIYNLLMLGIFILVIVFAKKMIKSYHIFSKERIKEENIEKILKRFYGGKKLEEERKKVLEVQRFKERIEKEIEEKIKASTRMAMKSLKMAKPEEDLIEEGGRLLTSFSSGLISAMPRTKQERKKDMEDLLNAVKALEDMDRDHYYKETKDATEDLGRGMHFYRITNQLRKIIRKEKLLKESPFYCFDKIIYLGLVNIKNISRKDLIDALPYLKDAGLIKNYIEINSQLYVINDDPELKFSNPEKVILGLAHEKEILTLSILMEETGWDEIYAKKIIKDLERKGVVIFADNVIQVKGFETREEKARRTELEKEIEEKKKKKKARKEKEQLRLKRELEIQDQLDINRHKETENLEAELRAMSDQEIIKQKAEEQIKKAEEIAKSETIKKFGKPTIRKLPLKGLGSKASGKKPIKIVETSTDLKVPKPAQETELKEEELIGVDDSLKKVVTEFNQEEKEIRKLIKEGVDAEAIPDKIREKMDEKATETAGTPTSSPIKKGPVKMGVEEDLIDALNKLDEELINTPEKTNISGSNMDDLDALEEEFASLTNAEFVGDELMEEISDEAIIDGIMSIYEQYEHMNGGLMDIRLIHKLLMQLYPDISIIDVINIIDKLKELGLVRKDISLGSNTVLLFKDIDLDKDMQAMLRAIIENGWMDKNELSSILNWDEEKTLKVMKKLQDVDVLRLDERNRAVIPGFLNEPESEADD
ncbi:MAG: hypothetical protein ACTSVC_10800 [Promethearchaeota archaeon]